MKHQNDHLTEILPAQPKPEGYVAINITVTDTILAVYRLVILCYAAYLDKNHHS